jgi:hypothetical protein
MLDCWETSMEAVHFPSTAVLVPLTAPPIMIFQPLVEAFWERFIERCIQVLVVPRSSRVLVPPPSSCDGKFLGNNSDEQKKNGVTTLSWISTDMKIMTHELPQLSEIIYRINTAER